jgi:ABC-2 type transport system ATP-binding protein
MITTNGLTKRYGRRTVVDGLTMRAAPGEVTGFLGPNGAGKTTTLRMILGLVHPSAGHAHLDGRPFRDLAWPGRAVGAVLDGVAAHPGRRARHHLSALARSHALPPQAVDAVLHRVGLGEVGDRRVGEYSLGMAQRLGVAEALLGDPDIVILDEPVNGLDVDGVRWLRGLLGRLAAEGRTVLVSSHLMSEMRLVADRLLVMAGGRLVADAAMSEILAAWGRPRVVVRTPASEALHTLLSAATVDGRPVRVDRDDDEAGVLRVLGMTAACVGNLAHAHGLPLHELIAEEGSLERAYLELTAGRGEYTAAPVQAAAATAAGECR